MISWGGDVVEMQTTGVYYSKARLNDEDLATRILAAYLESVQYYHETVLGNADQESESFKKSVATLAEATGKSPELIAAVDPNGEVNVDNIIATHLYEKA